MNLIVDGYNLGKSAALPLSRDVASEEGRAELCALLAAYSRDKGFRLTVVFDGRGHVKAERVRFPFKGGASVFSSAGETADDVIRDFSRTAPHGTVVVTSDRGLSGTLPSRNVTVLSCDDFAARLFAHTMEEIKGTPDDEPLVHTGKRGEGKKLKKKDRKRANVLRKL